jgi:hypothetical protein
MYKKVPNNLYHTFYNDKYKLYQIIYYRDLGKYFYKIKDAIHLQCSYQNIIELPNMSYFMYNGATYRIEGYNVFVCRNLISKSLNDKININKKVLYLGNLE